MRKISILGIFILGIIIGTLITSQSLEMPKGFFQYSEQAIPQDRISERDIIVYSDRIVINLPNSSLSKYADTNSMLPIIDQGANGIRIVPRSEEDIQIGDIVTFEYNDHFIVHRVIEIGTDQKGTYFITKGDNNVFDDGKIRFDKIRYITIGILY